MDETPTRHQYQLHPGFAQVRLLLSLSISLIEYLTLISDKQTRDEEQRLHSDRGRAKEFLARNSHSSPLCKCMFGHSPARSTRHSSGCILGHPTGRRSLRQDAQEGRGMSLLMLYSQKFQQMLDDVSQPVTHPFLLAHSRSTILESSILRRVTS